jgi:hypothetical protein
MGASISFEFNMKTPSRLCKYESFNTQSLENLKAQSVYFGSPLRFNDPYDCAIVPHIKTMSDEDVETIRKSCLLDPEIPPDVHAVMESASLAKLRQGFLASGEQTLREQTKAFAAKRGITCFSETNDDLLMWSHYGGRYKGFCLEFDKSKLSEFKFRKVEYSNELPTIDLVPILCGHDNADNVFQIYTTKAIAWAYEREWRAFHDKAGTLYTYPADALTGVYFGPDIGIESLEIICLILRGQNEFVRFWKGQRSSTEFKVEFEEIEYRSYLESQSALSAR